MFEVNNIKKSFKTDFWKQPVLALKDVSFRVSSGEIVGFLGANGAGRTTFLKALLGFISLDEGKIAFSTSMGERKEIFKNIVYEKKIKLDHNGAHNLLSQIYYGEEWLGSVENNFSGSQGKLVECFKTFNEFSVIAFDVPDLLSIVSTDTSLYVLFNVKRKVINSA